MKLPETIKRFFWDVDSNTLDTKIDSDFVISRLLEHGDYDAVSWLRKNFTSPEIINVIKSSRSLSLKTASFWALIFNINREEILCFNQLLTREQSPLWKK